MPEESNITNNPHFGVAEEAQKYDDGKNALQLLPFLALEEVGKVLAFGAKKYGDHNWRQGMKWSRLLGAALRHIFAWARGETLDRESGLSHLAHAACCILFLLEYSESWSDKDKEDDRYPIGRKAT